jgi:hypothetical protein
MPRLGGLEYVETLLPDVLLFFCAAAVLLLSAAVFYFRRGFNPLA